MFYKTQKFMVKIGDLVKLKAEPNSGQMVVFEVKEKDRNFPEASIENPVVGVRFWNEKLQKYSYDSFYFNNLVLFEKNRFHLLDSFLLFKNFKNLFLKYFFSLKHVR